MKILLIEDETELGLSVQNLLKKEGFKVEWVVNYFQAEEKINLYTYDCLLVDITLPDGSGLDIIRKLKERDADPGIIIITARDTINDRVEGLDLGADDYITKPFHLAELNSRVKALMRRRKYSGQKEITFGNMRISPESFQAFVLQEDLNLTRKEFDLLLFLVLNRSRVITRESIAEHLWGDYIDVSDSYDFIYSHVKNLRKKIVDKGGQDFIQNVYGIGYKIQAE
jgi:DNA-binding response OmpR family regulator